MTAATADAAPRQARFASAVSALRTRASAGDAERWFRLAGPVLMPLGALVVILGWWGAAHTTRVFLQIPYLISGGVLGLGLMFVGSFVYFARWLNDLLDESKRQAADAHEVAMKSAAALERIEHLLAQQSSAQAAAPVTSNGTLVATANGKLVHDASCRLVAGRETTVLTPADVNGREPCRICSPAI